MTMYKGFIIDPSEHHLTGKFILYKRGTDESIGTSNTVSEGIAIIDEILSQEKLFTEEDKILIEKLEQEYW